MDKTAEEKNAQTANEKLERRRAVPLTMEQWKAKASFGAEFRGDYDMV